MSDMSQLLLMKKGSNAHLYPRIIDLNSLFIEKETNKQPAAILIGRDDKKCDVILPEGTMPEQMHAEPMPDICFSRQHCYIKREIISTTSTGINEYRYSVVDKGSRNGTFVNWTKVSESVLKRNDLLVFGGGSALKLGDRLMEESDQPPIAYLFCYHDVNLQSTSPPTVKVNEIVNINEYSQISCHSIDAQLRLAAEESAEAAKKVLNSSQDLLGIPEVKEVQNKLSTPTPKPVEKIPQKTPEVGSYRRRRILSMDPNENAIVPDRIDQPSATPQTTPLQASPQVRLTEENLLGLESLNSQFAKQLSTPSAASKTKITPLQLAKTGSPDEPPTTLHSKTKSPVVVRNPICKPATTPRNAPIRFSRNAKSAQKEPLKQASKVPAAFQGKSCEETIDPIVSKNLLDTPPPVVGPDEQYSEDLLVAPRESVTPKKPTILLAERTPEEGNTTTENRLFLDSQVASIGVDPHQVIIDTPPKIPPQPPSDNESDAPTPVRVPRLSQADNQVLCTNTSIQKPTALKKAPQKQSSVATKKLTAAQSLNFSENFLDSAPTGTNDEKDRVKPKPARKVSKIKENIIPSPPKNKIQPVAAAAIKRRKVTQMPVKSAAPVARSGFEIMCDELTEKFAAVKKGKAAIRNALIKYWQNLDVAGKEAYDNRAEQEKQELILKHPELALLNTNQENDESRLARKFGGPKAKKDAAEQDKNKQRAQVRAARAQLFQSLHQKDEQTKNLMDNIEKSTIFFPESNNSEQNTSDTFMLEATKLKDYVTSDLRNRDRSNLSGRILATSDTKNILILPHSLAKLLKPHQIKGVQFLWKNLVQIKNAGGCILAHGMGLGKTLTAISFILMWKRYNNSKSDADRSQKHILVVAPKSMLRMWIRETEYWCEQSRHECPDIFCVENVKQGVGKIEQWATNEDGGILLLSYAMLVRIIGCTAGKVSSPSKQNVEPDEVRDIRRASQYVNDDDEAEQREIDNASREANSCNKKYASYIQQKTKLVIVDEGHKVSSATSALTKSLVTIRTTSRMILTGTPIQNNMKQYHTMLDFARPDTWGYSELTDLYSRASSDPSVKAELAGIMSTYIQRFDCNLLREELPPLTEYVLYIKLSPFQRSIYSGLMSETGVDVQSGKIKPGKALALSSIMLRIAAHTHLVRDHCIAKGVVPLEKLKKEHDITKITADDLLDVSKADLISMLNEEALFNDKGKDFSWALPVFKENYAGEDDALRHNYKTIVLLHMVKKITALGEKVVIFSDSTAMLDVIEKLLCLLELPQSRRYTSTSNSTQGWRKGVNYHRLDGQSSTHKRQQMCDDFNNSLSRSSLFLVSTRAGGLGINLVGASRVILYGVGWNAQSDLQAIYRTYRYGQRHPVTVYRIITQGTVEQTIFARSAAKMRMALQICDDRWTRTDLKSFDRIEPTDWSVHAAKDPILQTLYNRVGEYMHSVLAHDSLTASLDSLDNIPGEDSDDDEILVAPPEPATDSFGSLNLGVGHDDSIQKYINKVTPAAPPPPPPRCDSPQLGTQESDASMEFVFDDDEEEDESQEV